MHKIFIYDAATQKEILRDMTREEQAQFDACIAATQGRQAELEAQAAARQALLDKLGITEDEAKLLLGGN